MADDKNIQHHVHVFAFEWNYVVQLYFRNFKNIKSNNNCTLPMKVIWSIQCISNENITPHG